jgi:hypothetical protein
VRDSIFQLHPNSSFTKDSKKYVKDGTGNETSLSIQWLHKGNLEGGFLDLGHPETQKKALEMKYFFSQGLCKANPEVFRKGGLGQCVYWAATYTWYTLQLCTA